MSSSNDSSLNRSRPASLQRQDFSQGSPSPKQHFASPKTRNLRPPGSTRGTPTTSPNLLERVPEEDSPFAALEAHDKEEDKAKLQHRGTGAIVTEADVASTNRGRFDCPSARSLMGMQITLSLGYCAYMLTSWLYCAIQRLTLFPSCSAIWGGVGTWGAWGCILASLIFWTFPLFCCIVFLLYMYRDLLHTRLYYEMFAHNVHLDFMNIGFFQAPVVIVMLVWMGLCFVMYPMTWAVTITKILVTMPFWIPVLSFGAMLYQQWDLETRLLSVAKFVENDVEWANQHMFDSFFLRDYVAEAALQNVVKTLEKQTPKPQLTMGEYIMLICEEAERMHNDGEEPDEALASKTLVSSWSSRYWVKLILYSEYLIDTESNNFSWWFGIYKVFTLVMICFFLGLAFVTTVTHLHTQGVLPSSILTEWVHLDYLTIIPYNPGQVPGTSQANAVAATVTTGGYNYIRNLDRVGHGKVMAPPPLEPKMPRPISRSGVPTKHPLKEQKASAQSSVPTKHPSVEKKASTQSDMPTKPLVAEKEAAVDKAVQHSEQISSPLPSGERSIVPFGSRKKVTPDAAVRKRTDRKESKDKVDNSKLIDDLLNRFDKSDTVKRRTSQLQSMRSTAL